MAVLPVRFLAGAIVYFWRAYCFWPVVGPVEVVRVPWIRVLSAENYAVYETSHERDETEYKENYTQDPNKQWFKEL